MLWLLSSRNEKDKGIESSPTSAFTFSFTVSKMWGWNSSMYFERTDKTFTFNFMIPYPTNQRCNSLLGRRRLGSDQHWFGGAGGVFKRRQSKCAKISFVNCSYVKIYIFGNAHTYNDIHFCLFRLQWQQNYTRKEYQYMYILCDYNLHLHISKLNCWPGKTCAIGF